jgi:hypothetical protein
MAADKRGRAIPLVHRGELDQEEQLLATVILHLPLSKLFRYIQIQALVFTGLSQSRVIQAVPHGCPYSMLYKTANPCHYCQNSASFC